MIFEMKEKQEKYIYEILNEQNEKVRVICS